MSAQTRFLARWFRLKREAGEAGDAGEADQATPDANAAPEASVSPDRSSAPALDVCEELELPSIDAITRDTDIRAFLRSQVPADLARAALRKAWTSDPAIRDYIGIADNQWDFNDPHAMPGFGPLRATDEVQAMLARAAGRETLAVASVELPFPAEQEPLPAAAQPVGGQGPLRPVDDASSEACPDEKPRCA